MTLYELTDQWQRLMEMAEDPDINWDFFEDTLEALTGDIHDKADGYAKVIQNIKADISAIDAEIKRLQSRKQTASNAVERMVTALQTGMELTGETNFKTELFSFRIQNNPPTVVLDDLENIPEKYLVPQEPKINRTMIRDDIKAGVDLTGIAHLEQGQSLRIK